MGLYWPMHAGSTGSLQNEDLPDALTADAWPMRVAALRHIEKQGLELADYPQYRTLLTSEMPVERYWLARALAVSRSAATFTDLFSLVKDRHPNVRCQVYYALGKRGHRRAIQTIKAQMFVSDHWYTQWYGYRALRRLGWHQALSD
jgi:HEAT repeat protein